MNTKPKHKRVLRDGQTSRGPARWFRAADNAMRKPNSDAGQLFWDRASRARRLTREFPDLTGAPYGHWDWDFDFQTRTRRFEKFQYYTCSLFCCAMQVQLDQGINQYVTLKHHLTHDESAPQSGKPKRGARCQFCGTDIKP